MLVCPMAGSWAPHDRIVARATADAIDVLGLIPPSPLLSSAIVRGSIVSSFLARRNDLWPAGTLPRGVHSAAMQQRARDAAPYEDRCADIGKCGRSPSWHRSRKGDKPSPPLGRRICSYPQIKKLEEL
jgi:hypothetical protein